MTAVPSFYLYPNLVISCEDSDEASPYSYAYGRLLIDRAVKNGMFEDLSNSCFVPTTDVLEKTVDSYYFYPETTIRVTDLRSENISLKGRLCTSRGINESGDM